MCREDAHFSRFSFLSLTQPHLGGGNPDNLLENVLTLITSIMFNLGTRPLRSISSVIFVILTISAKTGGEKKKDHTKVCQIYTF